jgi:hypothetical protein
MEMLAARANMTAIVRMLHDPGSQLLDMLLEALGAGKLCVVELSQLRGGPSLVLSGLILRRIFDRNQEEFTRAQPRTIPTIAVLEEAQAVLRADAARADPYVEWVKEGRKYDLGAVLITQQPGSIPQEVLSQGDNWFVFHLLSAGDLGNVRRANAHFSEDLLATLLNEPIPGQGVFWSSVGGKPYPLPIRVLSFESLHAREEDSYTRPAVRTFAAQLRARFQQQVAEARGQAAGPAAAANPADNSSLLGVAAPGDVALPATEAPLDGSSDGEGAEAVDVLRLFTARAIQALIDHPEFQRSLNRPGGIPWGTVLGILQNALPASMPDREDVAKGLVPQAVSQAVGGARDVAWTTERRDTATRAGVLFIKRIRAEGLVGWPVQRRIPAHPETPSPDQRTARRLPCLAVPLAFRTRPRRPPPSCHEAGRGHFFGSALAKPPAAGLRGCCRLRLRGPLRMLGRAPEGTAGPARFEEKREAAGGFALLPAVMPIPGVTARPAPGCRRRRRSCG